MITRFLVVFFFCLATTTANAQTVQIGTGTDVPPNTLYGPVYRFSATSTTSAARCNMVFTQAEMAAAGIPPGALITSVEFNKTNSANFATPATFEMLMANTSNTSLATTDTWADILTTHTSVYSSTAFNMPLAAGWVSWNLSTPFSYTGGALEIATSLSMAGNGGATDKFQWEYTASVPADKLVGVSNSTSATLNGTVAAYKHRPNIKITYVMPFPCTSPPTAGAATISAIGGACANAPFQLDLTGNSSGLGQSYQWQSATSLTGTYTNVGSSLVAPSAIVNPPSNLYYRAAVTCGTSTTYSTPIQATVNPALPAGVYTIDPGAPASSTNFTSFSSVATALACGIAGNVTFKIASGTYTGQVYLPSILGASSTKRLTFESATGDASDVVIQYTPSGLNDNFVVKFDGASYITIKSVTLKSTGTGTYGRVLEFAGNSSYDSIVNCNILGVSTTSTSNYLANIFASGLTGSSNVFAGNTITNGSMGAYWYGASTASLTEDHVFVGNTVTDFNYYGLYYYYTSNLKLINNIVSTSSTYSTVYVVSCSYSDNALEIIGNRMSTNTTGTVYGLRVYYSDASATTRGIIKNNVLNINTSGTVYGLYSYYSSYQNYYNNTFKASTTGSTCYVGYFYHTSTTTSNIVVRNNIFSNAQNTGYALYVYNPLYVDFDYNNIHSNSANLVYKGIATATPYPTLESWRTASNMDMNSISYDPGFTSSSDLTPDPANSASWSLNGRGVQIIGNDEDINGISRPTLLEDGAPDLGAYEFTPTALPPLATPTPATPAAGTSQTFTFGQNIVASIDWAVGSTVPNTVEVRQYSGEIPPTLTNVSPGSFMYFYTGIETTPGTYDFTANINYMDTWLGTIGTESDLKMVKKVVGGKWFAYNFGLSSSNATSNVITAPSLLDDGYFSGIEDDVLFVAIVTPSATSFCPGEQVLLSANPGNNITYQWKRNGVPIPGATSITYQTTTGGTYEVEEVKNNVTIASDPITIVEVTPPPATITASSSVICLGGREMLYGNVGAGITYQWQYGGTDISGAIDSAYEATQPGNYNLVVYGNGCSTISQTLTITAEAMPVATIHPDTNVVLCDGDIINMTAAVPNSGIQVNYQWQNNGLDIPGATGPAYATNSQGNYTVIMSAVNCPSTASDGRNVFVVDIPEPEISVAYKSEGIYLFAGQFDSYQWYKDGVILNGQTAENLLVTENGNYTVEVSSGSCLGMSSAYTMRSVGVTKGNGTNTIVSVFPNPVQDKIYIQSTESISVKLYTIDGKLIHVGDNVTSIDVSTNPGGVYILQAFDENDVLIITERILKENE